MAVSFTHAILDRPIRGARWSVDVMYFNTSGVLTDPGTPDTEISMDNAAFTDCTEEVVVPAGARGGALHTFTGLETSCHTAKVWFGSGSGATASPMVFTPLDLASIATGTLSAGSLGGGTLGTLLPYDITNCFIKTTGGTGGGGANNQARKIMSYVLATGVFTCANWEITPDNTTTYSILLPENVTKNMVVGASTGDAYASAVEILDAAEGAQTAAETLEARLTATRAALLDNLVRLDIDVSDVGTGDSVWTTGQRDQVMADAAAAAAEIVASYAALVLDTEDIQNRLPATLTVNGNIKSDGVRLNGTIVIGSGIAGDLWRGS